MGWERQRKGSREEQLPSTPGVNTPSRGLLAPTDASKHQPQSQPDVTRVLPAPRNNTSTSESQADGNSFQAG